MAVAASLDGNARARLMLEVLGHHRGSAAQERERTYKHALVANGYQFRHPAPIARSQNGDRIASGGPEQLSVSFPRNLLAQALAVLITLGERAPRGLGQRNRRPLRSAQHGEHASLFRSWPAFARGASFGLRFASLMPHANVCVATEARLREATTLTAGASTSVRSGAGLTLVCVGAPTAP